MNEMLIVPESIVCVGLCLVLLLIIFGALVGYFKGLEDGRKEFLRKAKKDWDKTKC